MPEKELVESIARLEKFEPAKRRKQLFVENLISTINGLIDNARALVAHRADCQNCNHWKKNHDEQPCDSCTDKYSKWEPIIPENEKNPGRKPLKSIN